MPTTVARALSVLAVFGCAASASAQMPSGIVGGTDLLQESRRPVTGTAGSSERQVQTRTRSVGEGVGSVNNVSGSLSGAASPVPAHMPDSAATAGTSAPSTATPASSVAVEPGVPIRVRRPGVAPGEAVRSRTPSGPGAPIVLRNASR